MASKSPTGRASVRSGPAAIDSAEAPETVAADHVHVRVIEAGISPFAMGRIAEVAHGHRFGGATQFLIRK